MTKSTLGRRSTQSSRVGLRGSCAGNERTDLQVNPGGTASLLLYPLQARCRTYIFCIWLGLGWDSGSQIPTVADLEIRKTPVIVNSSPLPANIHSGSGKPPPSDHPRHLLSPSINAKSWVDAYAPILLQITPMMSVIT